MDFPIYNQAENWKSFAFTQLLSAGAQNIAVFDGIDDIDGIEAQGSYTTCPRIQMKSYGENLLVCVREVCWDHPLRCEIAGGHDFAFHSLGVQ